MGSKWSSWALYELDITFEDGDRSGRYPKANEFLEYGNHPFLNTKNIVDGCLDLSEINFLSDQKFSEIKKGRVNPNDIIISTRGSQLGKVAFYSDHRWSQPLINAQLLIIRVKDERLVPEYLYLLLNSTDGKKQIEMLKSGSAQPQLPVRDLKKLTVNLPDIKIQKKILRLHNSLDNKIILNRQINQTLEQMAQALFKSWFVDFDPVVDNALDAGFFEQDIEFPDELLRRAEARKAVRENADFKPLPEDIRQLFPAAFEKCSEPSLGLGRWVPKGWKPSNVGFEFDVTMGQSPPGSTYNEIGSGLPFFQGKTDFGFRFPSNRIYCSEPKRMAKKYDTLISVRAPVGDINLAAEDCAIGRGLAAARHKSGSISFTYYVMNSLSKYFEVFEGEGTVFGSINQKDFKALPLIKYPGEIITKFDEFCGNWDKRINNLSVEISTLTDLRDTLLPKLISGELRLSDSEVDTADEVLA
ncbi:TPA: restriction endonuclease subunit S [Enterobacter asburiae]